MGDHLATARHRINSRNILTGQDIRRAGLTAVSLALRLPDGSIDKSDLRSRLIDLGIMQNPDED